MRIFGVLAGLGSRTLIVGEIVSVVLLVKSCEPVPACTDETCATGGSAGSSSTSTGGGSAGSAGSEETGGGGEGGTGAGGSATGGTGGSAGGTGGTGGCEPTFACGPKNCGLVDDGCGNLVDCDVKDPNTGLPVTCASQNSGQDEGGPMVCGDNHTCECPAEGNSPEAMALCEGAAAEVPVDTWCKDHGGCSTALCGLPPVPKVPESCIYSGQALKPVPQDPSTWIHVWCCAAP